MDGDIARLPEICDLAEQHGALVMVDDSHATGFVGPTGRGTPRAVRRRWAASTSSPRPSARRSAARSAAASSGRREIIELAAPEEPALPVLATRCRRWSCGASLAVLRILRERPRAAATGSSRNQRGCRQGLTAAGFDLDPGDHPIVPVHFAAARTTPCWPRRMAADLLDEGIYVIGFSFPVVPKGQARIRVQVSAAHTDAHVDRCLEAFAKVGRRHGAIG